MTKVEVTIQDFRWPRLDVIILRGNMVQQFEVHYTEAAEKVATAVAATAKLAVEDILQRHNPTVRSIV